MDQKITRPKRLFRAFGLFAVLLVAGGCRTVLGIEDTRLESNNGGADGGENCPEASSPPPAETGLGWWTTCAGDRGCVSAGLPGPADRPETSDEGDALPRFFLAVRSARLGSRNPEGAIDASAWRSIGFDLDGRCTQSPTCPATSEGPLACRPSGTAGIDDGRYCRDNQLGRLDHTLDTLPSMAGRYMATDAQFNCSLCQGAYNLLFAVSEYNGQPNDRSVRLDLYPSPGLVDLKNVDCSADSWDPATCWARPDVWLVQEDHVPSGQPGPALGDAQFYDPTAYVREGVLVATLPDNTPLWFLGERAIAPVVPMLLQGGRLVAHLVRADSEWALADGVIAGRWRRTDLITGFEQVGLCRDDPNFLVLQTFAETSADLLSTGALLPDTPCDALSVGFAFTAGEATVGPLAPVTPPDGCGAGAGGAGP